MEGERTRIRTETGTDVGSETKTNDTNDTKDTKDEGNTILNETLKNLKNKLGVLFKNNTKAFLTDVEDNYYFCFITNLSEHFVTVKSFAGKRAGVEDILFLSDIKDVKIYKERRPYV